MAAIIFRNVSKTFRISTGRQLLRSHLSDWFGGARTKRFYALRNVSFQVDAGESVAVVGANGAGKTTLLSLVGGLCVPDEGEVVVNGHVAGLLGLASGFHPDLTGAENVRINASLLGMSRRQTEQLFERIVEFSGIGEFLNEHLRTYSAGMVMRLAFAVAIHVQPDILVLDEVFAVGDQEFQSKCIERVMSFRESRRTMLCVSHSAEPLRRMCDRAIWLDHGQIVMAGEVDEVVAAYEGRLARPVEAEE